MKVQPMQSINPKEIIDFEEYKEIFTAITRGTSKKRLMFVQAPGTCGKTSLLRILKFHCDQENIPSCIIDFRGQPYDNPHFSLAIEICSQIGLLPRHLANALYPIRENKFIRSDANITIGGNVSDSKVINQIRIGIDASHHELSQRYMKDRLNRSFKKDISAFAEKGQNPVLFFDSLEDISSEEEDWLINSLLYPICREELTDIIIVTAGRRWPRIEAWQWEEHAYLIKELPSMSVDHIKEYANNVGLNISEEQAVLFWKACRGGNPLLMGVVIKNLRSMMDI